MSSQSADHNPSDCSNWSPWDLRDEFSGSGLVLLQHSISIDHFRCIFDHPMDDRVLWRNDLAQAVLQVKFKGPHLSFDFLYCFFCNSTLFWRRNFFSVPYSLLEISVSLRPPLPDDTSTNPRHNSKTY